VTGPLTEDFGQCDAEWESGVACPRPDDMIVTAFHEAGHAAARLTLGLPFLYVTLQARADRGAIIARAAQAPMGMAMMSAAAGPAAQGTYLERVGCCDDCVTASVLWDGCLEDHAVAGVATDASGLVESIWPTITVLAGELLVVGRLTSAQCRSLLVTSVNRSLA